MNDNFISFIFCLFIFLSFIFIIPVQAKIIYVNVNCPLPGDGTEWDKAFDSIQDAIDSADPNGSDDQIWVAQGTYFENIELDTLSGISLFGGFRGNESNLEDRDYIKYETIIDGNNIGPVVYVSDTDNGLIDGFTIQKGSFDCGGGICCELSSIRITNCVIKDNIARYAGGGIFSFFSPLNIINNTILNNKAGFDPNRKEGSGGGIFTYCSSATIEENDITDNYSNVNGGGIYCRDADCGTRSSNITIKGNHIFNNKAIVGGAGIHLLNISQSIVQGNTIRNNIAGIDQNSQEGSGGGIFTYCSSATIEENDITDNYSITVGGGICCGGADCETRSSNITIKGNYIFNNKAIGGGGGIIFFDISQSIVQGNIIKKNIAEHGGGIFYGNLEIATTNTIKNNLIIQNKATSRGGGIKISNPVEANSASVNLINCTLFGNIATVFGNSLFIEKGSPNVDIKNSILWGYNMSESEIEIRSIYANIQISHSDIQNGYKAGYIGSGNIEWEPRFINPAKGIFHLSHDSPCRDSGDPDPNMNGPDGSRSDMGAYGGPEADWNPIIFGKERYWMEVGKTYSLQIPISTPDPSLSTNLNWYLTYLDSNSPNFVIDNTGTIIYQPIVEDIQINPYKVRILCEDEIGRTGSKDIEISICDTLPRIYIKAGATGNEGLSWGDALGNIQEGIDKAYEERYPEVWVAYGTYKEQIALKEGVDLYGGFKGDEVSLEGRDYKSYLTIIDGNVINGRNEGSVIIGANYARIDGFTITNGVADFGGGINCKSSSPLITHCMIYGNEARGAGGGIYCSLYANPHITDNVITKNQCRGMSSTDGGGGICCNLSSPIIVSNIILDNDSKQYGGGIFCLNNSISKIEHNEIRGNNTDTHGGGICSRFSSPVIKKNQLIYNRADSSGGGIYLLNDFDSIYHPIIESNNIMNNIAGKNYLDAESGGGIDCNNSSPIIRDNYIQFNHAYYKGGGIFVSDSDIPICERNIIEKNIAGSKESPAYCGGLGSNNSYIGAIDCVISNNSAAKEGIEIYAINDSNISIKDSVVLNYTSPSGIDTDDLVIMYKDDSTHINIINSVIWPWNDNIGLDPNDISFALNEEYKCLTDQSDPNGCINLKQFINVFPSDMKEFKSTSYEEDLTWSLPINNSGALIDQDGVYISGPGNGAIDIIKVTGNEGTIGWALLQIFSELKDPGIAIIVCGYYTDYPLNKEFTYAANLAYNTLINKGFKNILYLHANKSSLSDFENIDADSSSIRELPSGKTLHDYLKDEMYNLFDPYSGKKDEIQVVFYMIGHGTESSLFKFNDIKYLDPNDVYSILDIDPNIILSIDPNNEIKRIISIPILDFCYAGNFIQKLKGENSIWITSCADQELSHHPESKLLSFSTLFFTRIRKGKKIADAFQWVKDNSFQFGLSLDPQLEATGDDFHNNQLDIEMADRHLGLDIFGGGDWDAFMEISNMQFIIDPDLLDLWATVSRSTNIIDVYCVIEPPNPGINIIHCELNNIGKGKYELKEEDKKIFRYGGKYYITLYAQDNSLSLPDISISKQILILNKGEDFFEPDNSYGDAKEISTTGVIQSRTFHNSNDEDWVFFSPVSGRNYDIKAQEDIAQILPIRIYLYDSNLSMLKSNDNFIQWTCPEKGKDYYIKIKYEGDESSPNGIIYNLSVKQHPVSAEAGAVWGRVISKKSGKGVNGVKVVFISKNSSVNSCYTLTRDFEKNLTVNPLDSKISKGWYFYSGIGKDDYDISITIGSSTISTDRSISIKQPNQLYRIEDIVIEYDTNTNVYDPNFKNIFNVAYKRWEDLKRKGYCKEYDNDGDGLCNLEEFLFGTEPEHPDIKCYLYPGLNLVPFSNPTSDFDVRVFCSTTLKLEEDDKLYIYDEQNKIMEKIEKLNGEWTILSNPGNHKIKINNGKTLLIYKDNPQIIPVIFFQKEYNCKNLLTNGQNLRGGLNLIGIYSIDKGDSSLKFLKESGLESGIKSITGYRPESGSWRSSFWFFNRPGGEEFPVLPEEGYKVMYEKQ